MLADSHPLIKYLEQYNQDIISLEHKAKHALHSENNESLYRELMKEKASLLSKIDLNARSYLASLPDDTATLVRDTLGSFATNAHSSLSLNSVFYMSALLYPDEHQPGEPNNLQRFIDALKQKDPLT